MLTKWYKGDISVNLLQHREEASQSEQDRNFNSLYHANSPYSELKTEVELGDTTAAMKILMSLKKTGPKLQPYIQIR